jgi:hypothetical protein
MENFFFLFPVKEGQSDSYAHPILQRTSFPENEDQYVITSLREACGLDADLHYASQNAQSFYFSENVNEFCAGIIKKKDYPPDITSIRLKFMRQMTDASFLIIDSGDNCAVYNVPVSGKDYFVRIVDCFLSGKADGSILCVLPDDSGNRTINVRVHDQEVLLDGRASDFRIIIDWLSCHHHPSRTYEASPKHDYEHRVKGGSVASKWPYDNATSQSFLDKAFVDGKRLVFCGKEKGEALIFHEHRKNHFHGHLDDMEHVSNTVQKLLMKIGGRTC